MTSFSNTKRKLLQQINQSMNQPIPSNVKLIYDKAYAQSYHMDQKFKNILDPFGFVPNQHIQALIDKAKQTLSSKLKRQMQQTSQFSKGMYKKIIARQGNQFNFQHIRQAGQTLQSMEYKDSQILKAQKLTKKTQQCDPSRNQTKNTKTKQNSFNNQKYSKQKQIMHYRHQNEQVMETNRESASTQLNYSHIKILDTPQFQYKCRNVDFYQMLNSQKKDHHGINNQQFDIDKSPPVQKMCQKIIFTPIQNSCQYNSTSQNLYYDFQKNLKFWKQASKSQNNKQLIVEQEKVEKLTDQKILSNFHKFTKKQISVNNICDLAMGKITIDQLRYYLNLKKQHKTKIKPGRGQQNLQQMYYQLKKEYDYAHQLRVKSKSQRIPVKYIDTQSQTIRILQQKQFDDYFNEDVKQLFEKISKLNNVRQKAMKSKTLNNRFVLIKNACTDISDNLFKLLTMILKGEKFYPRQKKNAQFYAPFFTYNDLFNVENRNEVEQKILELIYTKIQQFECDYVDGISKSQLVTAYIQQRQRNNRILQIIQGL